MVQPPNVVIFVEVGAEATAFDCGFAHSGQPRCSIAGQVCEIMVAPSLEDALAFVDLMRDTPYLVTLDR